MSDDEKTDYQQYLDRTVMERMHTLADARMAYTAEPAGAGRDVPPIYGRARTRLSGKNQITLPVAMVRALSLAPGDEIDLVIMEGTIELRRRPQTPDEWADRLYGTLANVPEWKTKESIDAWIRNERDSWDREWDQPESSSPN
jgi:bifunctional DNA-binding transcriptional regulator/antitoxin component of YhaV-PrlF toxin-antitoxin module